MIDAIRDWLRPASRRNRPKRASGRLTGRQTTKSFRPSIDRLEDRRLLAVLSSAEGFDALVAASQAETSAEVVGRHIFYNHSRFDGGDPAANASDDLAIAIDKQALLVGQTATFENLTSYSGGINGVMIDVSGLRGVPTLDDFVFQVGRNGDPSTWGAAPEPTSISVRPDAGVDGTSRISITWADGAIKNQWLQVNVRPTSNTGLQRADTFFYGNLIGKSGARDAAYVNATDQVLARNATNSHSGRAPITSPVDYNRDGLVNTSDELIARSNSGSFMNALPWLVATPQFIPADVVGRYVFYNNSALDGNDPAPNANDDLAIAQDKEVLRPGGVATESNFTTVAAGINGIMVDLVDLPNLPSFDDFEFRVGNNDDPASWSVAPLPSDFLVRPGAGVYGSDRVTFVWSDGAIVDAWLQVTTKATSNTRLAVSDVFYIGNSPTGGVAQATATPGDSNLNLINLTGRDAEASSEVAFTDFVDAKVYGRRIFYNNSQFDGNDPNGNPADDAAIAPDKAALLPGRTGTVANYTSYTRGINGIMIDIRGLPDMPTADDFEFRMGNSDDLSEWVAAPAPTSITLRPGDGILRTSRITITWPDGWIRNTWLQVTVKATPRTGLTTPDVFYFGNLVGEAGNEADQAMVNWPDLAQANANPATFSNPASIASRYDYNRDTLVNSTDVYSTLPFGRELTLITPPEVVVAPQPVRQQPAFFAPGDNGFHTSFAPALVEAVDGTLLAFVQGRWSAFDIASQALVIRRSTDNGVTWSEVAILSSFPANTTDIVGGAAPVVHQITGKILMPFTLANSEVLLISSTDNGRTWSDPVDITNSVKVTEAGNPRPDLYPDDPWGWYATGPGHGIQIQNGPYAGRLIVAADHRYTAGTAGPSWSHVIYSDDHGRTWHLGGGPVHEVEGNAFSNEATVVEATDGSLYMGIRMNNGPFRAFSRSFDGGYTWTDVKIDGRLTTHPVHGSLLRVNENTILFSGPDSSDGTRRQMTIWVSHDDGATWTKTRALSYDYAGYSDMMLVGPDTVLISYNAGHANNYSADYVTLARFNLDWLLRSEPDEFSWYFNEEAPGARANILGTTITDASLWDNRAAARADSESEAPTYVAGVHAGDSALALTEGSDYVEMTPADTNALKFNSHESFTAQFTIRTSDADGVVIGSNPGDSSWELVVVDGLLQFAFGLGPARAEIRSDSRIDDGLWHRIAVTRDARLRVVQMYVDGQLVETRPDVPLGAVRKDRFTLGAYNDGSNQLAFEIDTMRVTRGLVSPSEFLTADFVAPPRYEGSGYADDAPNTIDGLRLWLPSYDPSTYFSSLVNSDPLPITPLEGIATQSAYDASGSGLRLSVLGDSREVLFEYDEVVGPHWRHQAVLPSAGSEWILRNPDHAGTNNFDFVQNTGEFTISAVIKPDQGFGIYMTLFDTTRGTSANSGWNLVLMPDGSLAMGIIGQDQTPRVNATSPAGLITANNWYHVVAVGRGPGQPIRFYITSLADSTVSTYFAQAINGPNGTYPSSPSLPLTIGALSGSGQAAFNGSMVDQAIYDRALTVTEIQQLFDYTKRD